MINKFSLLLQSYLSVIKSFYKYVQRREPSLKDSCSKIIHIENEKAFARIISYFADEEIKLLIHCVKVNMGFKSLLLVSLFYDLVVHDSELIDIQISNLSLHSFLPLVVIRNSKSNKTRIIPISNKLKQIIEEYLNKAYIDYGRGYLLYTTFKNPYTRFGIYDFVDSIVTKLNHQYPNLFRHYKAIYLYNNSVMLQTIKGFLSYLSITATEINICNI